MIPLQHRAAQAMAAIDTAKTPAQQYAARQEGLGVKADLEKQISDEMAVAAFKAAKPQNTAGVWKGQPRVFHMARADGSKPTAAVSLPDGSQVMPIQGQIAVPENLLAAMAARGWKRANDASTELGSHYSTTRDPALNSI